MSRHGHRHRSAHSLKYAAGVGAPVPPHQRPLRPIEWAVLAHLVIFLLAITWGFGGAAEWLRPHFTWLGGIGVLIMLTAAQDREARQAGWLRPLQWLWPLAAFNVFVLVGCLNPSFTPAKFGSETLFVNSGGKPWLPSSARPGIGLETLALFDGIWISCLNLALVVRQRRVIRGLLIIAGANALALAVFGTLQHFAQAKGLYFDLVKSPQIHFFASFVYHNHWGAFAVLMLAAVLGLVWHYGRRRETRDVMHSPVLTGLVAAFFIAASVPLSTSRSCSILVLLLVGGTILHWLGRQIGQRRQFRESIAPPLVGVLAAVVIGAAGIWFVARDSIILRTEKTREQVEEMRAKGTVGDRVTLYRDTWHMARDKLWFGWGMGSYPHVFTLYNTKVSRADRLPVFFADAHSDWLQALAEHGVVGSVLLGLSALVPLRRLRLQHVFSPVPTYLFAGCLLILLYAWIEFPFGNPAVVFCWWLGFFCAVHYARLYSRDGVASPRTAASPASHPPLNPGPRSA